MSMSELAAQDSYGPAGDATPWDTLKRYASAPRRAIEGAMGSVLSLPQRAFQASEQMRTEGPYDPAPAVEAAMLPMGTGAVAGVKALPGEAVLGAGPIRAYHSSPHDFERFDLSKIGTGEGAQAYGHGLYFAESPAVSGQGGQYWQQFARRFEGTPEGHAAAKLKEAKFDREAAINDSKWNLDQIKDYVQHGNPQTYDEVQRWHHFNDKLLPLRQAEYDLLASGKPVGPRTYKVNINADPAHFLDWDKPLGRQADVAQRVSPLLEDYKLAPSNYLGESLHNEIRNFHVGHGMSKPAAAEAASIDLRSTGIPGIKYLDQGSRFAQPVLKTTPHGDVISSHYPPPTSNYVVFNDKLIDILKKYGLAGAVPAGIGALAAQDRYQGE